MSSSSSSKPGRAVQAHRRLQESARMHPAMMMGSSFAVAMGLFAWLGHRWDEKTGRAPLGVLLGVSVAFLYGGYEVWKLIRWSDRGDKGPSEVYSKVESDTKGEGTP